MEPLSTDSNRDLRLLEVWLPVAQDERERAGWSDDSAALEQLVLRAAPALRRATGLAAARMILHYYHWLMVDA